MPTSYDAYLLFSPDYRNISYAPHIKLIQFYEADIQIAIAWAHQFLRNGRARVKNINRTLFAILRRCLTRFTMKVVTAQ